MQNPEKPMILFLVLVSVVVNLSTSKSTIEPCSSSDACNAMLGYTLYTDLKVSEVASLFQVDPISLLLANAIDISYPDVENYILPKNLFLKIPITCSCVDGIRKSVSTRYKTRPSDTLDSVADSVFSGLVSAAQLGEANSITDPAALDVGRSLVVPMPCTCFNNTDNSLPAVFLSYVVRRSDTLDGIAKRYYTTVTDLMNVNAMGSSDVKAGDILAVPLSACGSRFASFAEDLGLIIPNGSYGLTASHCVQCSCGPGSHKLYCQPAPLAVSCSSMQCRNSNLMLGNVTTNQASGGCQVTSCSYNGFVNGRILTALSTSLQPQCPEPPQLPRLEPPPTSVPQDSTLAPTPAPESGGRHGDGAAPGPRSSPLPSTGSHPANGPAGSILGASSVAFSSAAFFITLVSHLLLVPVL